jgi:hypothetical protein
MGRIKKVRERIIAIALSVAMCAGLAAVLPGAAKGAGSALEWVVEPQDMTSISEVAGFDGTTGKFELVIGDKLTEDGWTCGAINAKGEVKIPFGAYKSLVDAGNGLLIASKDSDESYTDWEYDVDLDEMIEVTRYKTVYGVIDYNNKAVLPFVYSDLQSTDLGLLVAWQYDSKNDINWPFIIDKNGVEVLSWGEYLNIDYLGEGFFSARNIDGDCGVIDKDNKTIIPFEYYSIHSYFGNRVFGATKIVNADTYVQGAINTQNKVVIPFGEYDRLSIYAGFAISPAFRTPAFDGYLFIEKNSLVGVADTTGKIVIPIKYKGLGYLGSGLFSAYNDTDGMIGWSPTNSCGIIDANNNVVVPFEYSLITPLGNGLFGAGTLTDGEQLALKIIDKNNSTVLTPGKDITAIQGLFEPSSKYFNSGLFKVSSGTYPEYRIGIAKLGYFADISTDAWYYKYVTWAADNAIVSGYPDNTFRPSNTMTRAEFVQVLYNLEGKPKVTVSASFTDVAAADWYATAVSWAVSAGVTSGIGGGLFDPSGSVTREQAVMFLYKYAQMKGDSKDYSGVALTFGDTAAISAWAVPAVQWSKANGVVSGYPDGTFGPQNTATRAEVVTILYGYVN